MAARPTATTRRSLLRAGLAGLTVPAAGSLVTGCVEDTPTLPNRGSASPLGPTPDRPVLWPLDPENRAVADGLEPERDHPLKVFAWSDYVDTKAIRSFQRRTGLTVSISSFSNSADALNEIADPVNSYDVYIPHIRQLPDLVNRKLLRPVNHSYIPNISQVWPEFQNPFYDQAWRYSVPYTVYGSGITWRSDVLPENPRDRPNPYDILWDEKYRDRVSVIDNYRAVIGLVLLRNNLDLNTTRETDLALVRAQLAEMIQKTRPKRSITDFLDVASGKFSVVQAWSGDVINAIRNLPAGVPSTTLHFWSPSDGRGQAENDVMVLPRQGRAPVAAHLFLNHMLDPAVARENFQAIGYQPPQNTLTNASAVSEGLIPPSLGGVLLEPQQFAVARRILTLPAEADRRWRAVWQEFWDNT